MVKPIGYDILMTPTPENGLKLTTFSHTATKQTNCLFTRKVIARIV